MSAAACRKAGLAARERLAALNRRRDQLVANRQQERTRQRECSDPFSRQSIAAHLAWLDAAIEAIQAQIAAAIAAEPELEHDRRLLSSARSEEHTSELQSLRHLVC